MQPKTLDARENMSIGALAAAAHVPPSTIRYYERRGLLSRPGRSRSGYRQYGPPDLERLRFIRAGQAMGLALDDVAVLLRFEADGSVPCRDVRALLQGRLQKTKEQLVALRRARAALVRAIELCDSSPRNRCRVIETLRDANANPIEKGEREL